MYIDAYIYIYIHTCTYTYIHVRTHTHLHIYTHTYKMYICTHASTSETTARQTAREARLDAKKLRASPCPLQSGGGLLFVASSPIARPRGTTDKRRTTTTNSSSSHHHDSAPSRPHPLICTGAMPICPVHGPPKLPAWPWLPETRSFSCYFGEFFSVLLSSGVCEHQLRSCTDRQHRELLLST